MNEPIRYGQARSEKLAEENQTCRQIVKEIGNFGISERQRALIIYLLALELENAGHMQAIAGLVKDLVGKEMFVSGEVEGTGGSIDV